jgi:type I restriction enzyme S subunit
MPELVKDHEYLNAGNADQRSLPEGWEIKKLGEVCEFLNRGISPKYIERGGICVLNQKCIRDHSVNYELARRHDITIKNVQQERFVKLGDVIVNSTGTGTLGRVAQIRKEPEEQTTVDSHVTIVRPKEGIFFQDFFGYMLILIEEEIKESGEGCGGQTELARTVLAEKFHINYPKSLPEQQRIVAILDRCFAAIDKAKAHAERCLRLSKALFESYLQGVFTSAPLGEPYRSRSLSGAEGSGWEEKNLGDIGNPKMCKRIFKDQTKPVGDIPFYKIGTFGKEPDAFISKEIYTEYKEKYSFPKIGDILISASGTIGRRVKYDGKPAYFQDSNIVWIDNDEKQVLNEFLFEFYGACNWSSTKGATISRLYNDNLKSIKITFPKSLEQQQTIVQQLDALRAETQKLEAIYQKKSENLDELKKSILQKAFSGELNTAIELMEAEGEL